MAQLIEPKGENSYGKVHSKVKAIEQADYITQQYQDLLVDNFVIGETYTESEIMSIVGAVRNDLNLVQYLTGIKKNSLRDLFSLFIVRTLTEEIMVPSNEGTKIKKQILGYSPLFNLKPQDE